MVISPTVPFIGSNLPSTKFGILESMRTVLHEMFNTLTREGHYVIMSNNVEDYINYSADDIMDMQHLEIHQHIEEIFSDRLCSATGKERKDMLNRMQELEKTIQDELFYHTLMYSLN